jgi:NADH pyrophosphatase NudC (nudix superfamily)
MDDQEENKSWDTLYEKYPDMFSNRHKSPMESCMSWGCEIGMGWYDILSSLCWMISQHEENIAWQKEYKEKQDAQIQKDFGIKIEEDNEYFPVKFDQIKEKFGGLRVYYSGGDSYVGGLVGMASTMSYQICEICGERGQPNKGGWIVTLCDKCRQNTK